MDTVRKHPTIHEIDLEDKEHYDDLIDITVEERDIVPLFTKSPDGSIEIIPANSKDFTPKGEGFKLVYLGREIQVTKEEKNPEKE